MPSSQLPRSSSSTGESLIVSKSATPVVRAPFKTMLATLTDGMDGELTGLVAKGVAAENELLQAVRGRRLR